MPKHTLDFSHPALQGRDEESYFPVMIRVSVLIVCFLLVLVNNAYSQNAWSSIKIGLLIRDKNDSALINCARLAIETANLNGGYKGGKFELIVRSCDGPWGVGSKQSVDLMQEQFVSLVVAALDGRNAHLAEQVAAKSHIVLLDALASDPTLSRAYVPWYYRMVPDDKQQAAALMEQIYLRGKAKNVAIISLDNYDGKKSAEAFTEVVKSRGLPEPTVFIGINEQLSDKIANTTWDAIVLAGSSTEQQSLISLITKAGRTRVYAFQNLFNFIKSPAVVLAQVYYPKVSAFKSEAWTDFEMRYKSKYKENPSPSLGFLYDAMLLAAEAVRKYGPDSQVIKDRFKSLKFHGITGPVVFGSLGNRELELTFVSH